MLPTLTVTITIAGETSEVVEEVRRMLGSAPTSIIEADEPPVDPAAWTSDEVERVWRLLTPDCREVLAEIARRPRGYHKEALRAALQMSALSVAGRLSSLGHRERLIGKPSFLHRTDDGYYFMDAEVAPVIRRLADQD